MKTLMKLMISYQFDVGYRGLKYNNINNKYKPFKVVLKGGWLGINGQENTGDMKGNPS